MDLSTNQINNIYKIIAYSEFNTERKILLEDILKIFLLNRKESFNIKKESIKYRNNIISNIENYRNMPIKMLFRDYDKISSSMFILDTHHDYLTKIFTPYEKEFSMYYNMKLSTYCQLSFFVHSYVNEKLIKNNFSFDVYKFKNKREYTDLSFFGIPDDKYFNIYKNAVTINIKELVDFLVHRTDIKEEEIYRVIDRLSFKINQINDYNYFRFQDKPILQIDDNNYIVLFKNYLINTLNQRLNVMFNNVNEYRDNKGKLFEKLALKIINTIPKSKVYKNIRYNKYELDGILHLKNIDWFIECSSHPPQYSSFMDDEISIINDIKSSVKKCEEQALRAIRNRDHPNINKYIKNEKLGIIIILNGMYPNLNRCIPFYIIPKISNYRRFIINYWDLNFLMKQPEKHLFDDYLTWRTQDKFPINGIDETDVWTWYLNYHQNKKAMKAFYHAMQNENSIEYIGNRFNDKRYLNKLRDIE